MSQAIFAPVLTLINAGFESSSYLTPEFKKFSTKFRSAMKKTLEQNGAKLESFSRGHFECSGFYSINGKIGYFSLSDVRSSLMGSCTVMFRTASSLRDYTGGNNNWLDLENDNVGERLVKLIN